MTRFISLLALCSVWAATAAPPKSSTDSPIILPPVQVQGSKESISKVGGSAHTVDEEELEAFEYNNAEAILGKVPGVTIRTEDGYGLRPNIGIRGANSDRSKKVTLMEDGVLFGPAPYSAPAAYYFPLLTRITGLEVFKGPAAILYGPQTIGGAINFFTRAIPEGSAAGADLAYGSSVVGGTVDNYHKVHGWYGYSGPQWGVLAEGVHLMTDGFKTLDTGGNTGFDKQEFMVKLRGNSDPDADDLHKVELKLGFSRERSNETYLGLTDADFADNPYRRYAASQMARMDLLRSQAELSYDAELSNGVTFRTVAYHHWMTRDWRKLNRMGSSTSLTDILANPTGIRRVLYDVLTGAQDSSSNAENLWIGTNGRTFHSLGLDTNATYAFTTDPVDHELRLGLRYHYDQIVRAHTEDEFAMVSRQLQSIGTEQQLATSNFDSAHAVAGVVQYALRVSNLTIQPGLRLEWVHVARHDRLADTDSDSADLAVLPGVSLHYEVIEGLGILAGVHRGFSPVAPGQADDVRPEFALNYEFGLRYQRTESQTLLEAIGFISDYSNLVGQCTLSSGCDLNDLDQQFNGGEAFIAGVELVAQHTFGLPRDYAMPIRASYTYTHATFETSFQSANPQFGDVEAGDTLPYVAPHQMAVSIGLAHPAWSLNLGLTYFDRMLEVAGGTDNPKTDAAWLVDASVSYSPFSWMDLYVTGENIANQQVVASRRPFGARPVRPLQLMGGLRLRYN